MHNAYPDNALDRKTLIEFVVPHKVTLPWKVLDCYRDVYDTALQLHTLLDRGTKDQMRTSRR